MTPHRGNTISSIPPSNSLVSVSLFASGTTEIQGHRQVCSARRGGPRTLPKTVNANFDCAFVENALFYTRILDFEKSTVYRIELVTRTDNYPPNNRIIILCFSNRVGCLTVVTLWTTKTSRLKVTRQTTSKCTCRSDAWSRTRGTKSGKGEKQQRTMWVHNTFAPNFTCFFCSTVKNCLRIFAQMLTVTDKLIVTLKSWINIVWHGPFQEVKSMVPL